MLKVTGASTGPLATAQPVINAAQDNASARLFIMDFLLLVPLDDGA
jgi:hypothetical protein